MWNRPKGLGRGRIYALLLSVLPPLSTEDRRLARLSSEVKLLLWF
jgi:hypothetical protein